MVTPLRSTEGVETTHGIQVGRDAFRTPRTQAARFALLRRIVKLNIVGPDRLAEPGREPFACRRSGQARVIVRLAVFDQVSARGRLAFEGVMALGHVAVTAQDLTGRSVSALAKIVPLRRAVGPSGR